MNLIKAATLILLAALLLGAIGLLPWIWIRDLGYIMIGFVSVYALYLLISER